MANLAELLSVVENETDRAVLLSGSSIALLFTALGEYLDKTEHWVGSADFGKLTDEEKDTVDAMVSLAEKELMTEVSTMGETGIIFMSPADRDGALFCDGTQYQRVDYPNLYDFLEGTVYIVDADNFVVPDLGDVFVLGSDTPGDTGGEAEHVLTIAEMPQHQHQQLTNQGIAASLRDTTGSQLPTISSTSITSQGLPNKTGVLGDDEPHNNMPPYHTMRFYIWT